MRSSDRKKIELLCFDNTFKEEELVNTFSKVGLIPKNTGFLPKNKAECLVEKGWIEEAIVFERNTNNMCEVYKASSELKRYIKENYFKIVHLPSTARIQHEYERAKIYFKLPKNIRKTWESEKELIKKFQEKNNIKSINKELGITTWIDARIYKDKEYIGICIAPKVNAEKVLKEKENVAYNYMNCSSCKFVNGNTE